MRRPPISKRRLLSGWFGRRRSPSASELSPEEIQARIDSVDHWYHRIEVAPGTVTPGLHDSKAALESLELPESMEGRRVLDVGARDGFFSFAAEARGAKVLAIDSVAREHLRGFDVASALLGSAVEYRTMNVYKLTPMRVGTFDAIFFLGVLYHLRDPMLALDRLWDVARPGAEIWVESHTIDKGLVDPETGVFDALSSVAPKLEKVPIAQFYPRRTLGSNFTNWWGPNLAGLEAMVEASGFKVLRSRVIGSRGLVMARKEADPETDFYRGFDRAEGTGEEGMSWDDKARWGSPRFGWSGSGPRDSS
jgi:tRNA (mo5U34)-methyltransferase